MERNKFLISNFGSSDAVFLAMFCFFVVHMLLNEILILIS